jgi:hypothetical protein
VYAYEKHILNKKRDEICYTKLTVDINSYKVDFKPKDFYQNKADYSMWLKGDIKDIRMFFKTEYKKYEEKLMDLGKRDKCTIYNQRFHYPFLVYMTQKGNQLKI